MKKLGFILGVTCSAAVVASGLVASRFGKAPERDAQIIVEVNRGLNNLSKEAVRKSQDVVYDNIKQYATSNVRMVQRYDELNNAFVMEINSNDIESVRTVPGVKSVTIDKAHKINTYDYDGYVPFDGDEGDPGTADDEENISAVTMNKPDQTNDGEGTIVAILDNEFHLRGKKRPDEAWGHEAYGALDDDVAVKYTYDSIGEVIQNQTLKAGKRKVPTSAGTEGSFYYNSKVPFYYDYGGYTKNYGKAVGGDYDVHSDLGYHGSHVSSITAGNAPAFKGIAPKAQLALMKVATDYDAKGIGEKLGFSSGLHFYESNLLNALEDCIKLKVDGINMSLGSDLDDFDGDSITLKTLTNLSNAGILTSISAGNAGKSSYSFTGAYGNWTTDMVETGILGSYANKADCMIIASGHPTKVFYESAFQTLDGAKNIAFEDQIVNRQGFDDDYPREIRIRDIFEGEPLEWVYVPGFGTSGDYTGLNVDGKIAVVNRGSTSFADKYAIAAGKGAAALVIINNDPTASDFNFRCSFGDGFNPTIPCALVLFKDKSFFESTASGQLNLISKQVSDNPNKFTVSDFSSDGATFDLDLKPDITTPGDNIKGAVPEHAMTNLTKEEKESDEYKYKCYQYLSGTSMAAPNYAGAQSVVLSKVASPIYAAAKAANRDLTNEEKAEIDAERAKVDMRLMSTANPMFDLTENPETGVKTISSPRVQGAGMADLTGALNSDVYLEGVEYNYKTNSYQNINKSKVVLRNNPDIAKGDIKLSFLAHNEGQQERQYDVKVSVMRPALAQPNDIVTREYNLLGEVEKISSIAGWPYYDVEIYKMATGTGSASFKDAIKISKDIDYFASEEDYLINKKTVFPKGYYYNASKDGIDWQPLPSYTAQSTQDVQIAEVVGQTITVPANSTEPITINPYSLPEAEKDAILANYEYGCMIEGYVTLVSKDGDKDLDLSIPYLGFYSGTDRDDEASYDTAPVAEPFNFEKDITKVYPSDLVNDVAKSLVGKNDVNFESMIMVGYAEKTQAIDTDKILTNDTSFDKLPGFYKAGSNPINNEYMDNPDDNIYVGNPNKTNTMIIHQFMLRSVLDNYFTITNKETNEEVFKSSLEDMLFGDSFGKYSLYKSHVDGNYLAAGYIAHRAYAIVPLYDETTGEAFDSGEYELKFNYQLMGTGHWVDKSYTLHIDSESPVVKTISQYRDDNGVERVRFYFDEGNLAYGNIGYYRVNAQYDNERKLYYLDETSEFVKQAVEELSNDEELRLFVGGTDYARGTVGCIVHAEDFDNFNLGFMTVQAPSITARLDFEYYEGNIDFYDNLGRLVQVNDKILINGFPVNVYNDSASGANGSGNVGLSFNATLLIVSAVALTGATLVIISLLSKKKKGGR